MSNIKHYLKRAPVYGAACGLVGVSAIMNARYGATLGNTDIDRAAWMVASVSSDILKAASPLALVWSWRNRNVLTGIAAAGLLSITITYSAIAAIGFSASARDATASQRNQIASRIERTQAAYNSAAKELASIGTPRPVAALEARIKSILANPLADTPKGPCGIHDGDYTRKYCPIVADLKIELAKARRKNELQASIDKARTVLDAAPAMAMADPQGEALASFGRAVGIETSAAKLRPWLAGIAALLVELGSVFGFLVASAGKKPARKKPEPKEEDFPAGPVIDHEPIESPVSDVLRITHETGMAPVEGIERRSCGRLRVSQRRLADAMGESRRAIAQKLEELASLGKISIEPTRAGTMITVLA